LILLKQQNKLCEINNILSSLLKMRSYFGGQLLSIGLVCWFGRGSTMRLTVSHTKTCHNRSTFLFWIEYKPIYATSGCLQGGLYIGRFIRSIFKWFLPQNRNMELYAEINNVHKPAILMIAVMYNTILITSPISTKLMA